MTLTNPYRQQNYMGEYSTDANCLTFIQGNKWDSNGNGTGTPRNGMFYYNTTTHVFKVYMNGAWGFLSNPESKIIYVGKHGNNSSTGKSLEEAVLTFNQARTLAVALTPSASNRITIVCFDDGIYDESLTGYNYVDIFAPNVTLSQNGNGFTYRTANYSSVVFNRIVQLATTSTHVAVSIDSTTDSQFQANYVECGASGGYCVHSNKAGGDCNMIIQRMKHVTASAIGLYVDAGYINIQITEYEFGANSQTAFRNAGGTLSIIVNTIKNSGYTGTYAFTCDGGTTMGNVLLSQANTQLNSTAGALFIFVGTSSGVSQYVTGGENFRMGASGLTMVNGNVYMNGKRLYFDTDATSYDDHSTNDTIARYFNGNYAYTFNNTALYIRGGRSIYINDSGDTESVRLYRAADEWLRDTGSGCAYITDNIQSATIYWQVKRSGTTIFFITDNGSNGAGSYIRHARSYYHAVGATYRQLYVDTNGDFGYLSSSIRYKKDVRDIGDVSWLFRLRPVRFKYKDDPMYVEQYGLIAEEAEEVNKEIVQYDQDGEVDSVDYEKLIPALLKEVQNQRVEIEKLKEAVELLKSS